MRHRAEEQWRCDHLTIYCNWLKQKCQTFAAFSFLNVRLCCFSSSLSGFGNVSWTGERIQRCHFFFNYDEEGSAVARYFIEKTINPSCELIISSVAKMEIWRAHLHQKKLPYRLTVKAAHYDPYSCLLFGVIITAAKEGSYFNLNHNDLLNLTK